MPSLIIRIHHSDGMAVIFRNLTQKGFVRAVWAIALGLTRLAVSTSSFRGVFPELNSRYNCKAPGSEKVLPYFAMINCTSLSRNMDTSCV